MLSGAATLADTTVTGAAALWSTSSVAKADTDVKARTKTAPLMDKTKIATPHLKQTVKANSNKKMKKEKKMAGWKRSTR